MQGLNQTFSGILNRIVNQPDLHARWLNTLSLMENSGARKISAGQDPKQVELTVLKHAAEESRHAFYFKNLLRKFGEKTCPTYESPYLLAARTSRRYLDRLDLQVSRYLKKSLGLSGTQLKYAAYLLVTYAIELRAQEIYPLYETLSLKSTPSISVRPILLEEEGHLKEMEEMLESFFSPNAEQYGSAKQHQKVAQKLEKELFEEWLKTLESDPALA